MNGANGHGQREPDALILRVGMRFRRQWAYRLAIWPGRLFVWLLRLAYAQMSIEGGEPEPVWLAVKVVIDAEPARCPKGHQRLVWVPAVRSFWCPACLDWTTGR